MVHGGLPEAPGEPPELSGPTGDVGEPGTEYEGPVAEHLHQGNQLPSNDSSKNAK